MSSTGIFWIREDFRIENNPALSFATQNHDNVIALYIYNNNDFDNKREAQKWWVFKSLETLKKELSDYKINLEIVKGNYEKSLIECIKQSTENNWQIVQDVAWKDYMSSPSIQWQVIR